MILSRKVIVVRLALVQIPVPSNIGRLTKDYATISGTTRPSALGMSDPVLEFLKISKNYNQFSFLNTFMLH